VPVANRMNREQFHAATAQLGPAELRKVLWTVYWRGTATVRERIETELAPDPVAARRKAAADAAPDPDEVLSEAREFVALVRSGAYVGGSRAVSPKERTRWRFTFRHLVADARAALGAEDLTAGAAALTELIGLACELRDYDYVRSDDPVGAAGVVVSDEVAVLWRRLLEQRGFDAFAAAAAEQFVRWESRYGWTRGGYGKVADKESTLTDVLACSVVLRGGSAASGAGEAPDTADRGARQLAPAAGRPVRRHRRGAPAGPGGRARGPGRPGAGVLQGPVGAPSRGRRPGRVADLRGPGGVAGAFRVPRLRPRDRRSAAAEGPRGRRVAPPAAVLTGWHVKGSGCCPHR
jgi:hypothetical protein